jgi:hypothetical protein
MSSQTRTFSGTGTLMLLPVLVLIVVALNQARLHSSEGLSSWRGGGFGMFATVDRDTYRDFVIKARLDDGSEAPFAFSQVKKYIDSDTQRSEDWTNLQSFPSQANLLKFANSLEKVKWNLKDKYLVPSSDGTGFYLPSQRMSIDVYIVSFNKDTNKVTPELLTSWKGSQA